MGLFPYPPRCLALGSWGGICTAPGLETRRQVRGRAVRYAAWRVAHVCVCRCHVCVSQRGPPWRCTSGCLVLSLHSTTLVVAAVLSCGAVLSYHMARYSSQVKTFRSVRRPNPTSFHCASKQRSRFHQQATPQLQARVSNVPRRTRPEVRCPTHNEAALPRVHITWHRTTHNGTKTAHAAAAGRPIEPELSARVPVATHPHRCGPGWHGSAAALPMTPLLVIPTQAFDLEPCTPAQGGAAK